MSASPLQFRQLTTADVPALTEISLTAYPGSGINTQARESTSEWLTDAIELFPPNDLWGVFRAEQLVAGMGTLRFQTNIRGTLVPTWGVGSLAVGMLHKREGLAHELIRHFLAESRRQGYTIVSLFPFRVDFYKKMGFGHAARRHQYRIKPASFPRDGGKEHLVMIGGSPPERKAVLDCYNRFLAKTHGAVSKVDPDLGDLIHPGNRVVAYRLGDEVLGYIVCSFEVERTFKYQLMVKEFVWETPEALRELLTFLHDQRDQVERVIIDTPDDQLHLLISDPASGQFDAFDSHYLEMMVTGVGAMYRVIDLPGLISKLEGQRIGYGSCRVRIHLQDPFSPENESSVLLRVEDGVVQAADAHTPDVAMTIGVGEFSSLLLGGADLLTLHRYGLARVSDERYIPAIAGIFAAPHKPMWTSLHF